MVINNYFNLTNFIKESVDFGFWMFLKKELSQAISTGKETWFFQLEGRELNDYQKCLLEEIVENYHKLARHYDLSKYDDFIEDFNEWKKQLVENTKYQEAIYESINNKVKELFKNE